LIFYSSGSNSVTFKLMREYFEMRECSIPGLSTVAEDKIPMAVHI